MKPFWIFLTVIACIAGILAAFWVSENVRGKNEWEAYRRDREAHGDSMDFKTFIPPPVPDDQNFAMTPLLKPIYPNGTEYAAQLAARLTLPSPSQSPRLGSRELGFPLDLDVWKIALSGTDVLIALQKFDPELREISQAVRRPYSRFSIPYDHPAEMRFPHPGVIDALSELYLLRSAAELRAGKPDIALDDVQTIFLLGESMNAEPSIDSMLFRARVCGYAFQAVWEGLHDHRWSERQVEVLQETMGRLDFLKDVATRWHGNHARISEGMIAAIPDRELLSQIIQEYDPTNHFPLALLPPGWIYQNILTLNRRDEALLAAWRDSKADRIYPGRLDAMREANDSPANSTVLFGTTPDPYLFLVEAFLDYYAPTAITFSYAQASRDEAVLACALERYRLAKRHFPETLEELVPDYIKMLPRDLVTGGKLNYLSGSDRSYIFYEVGWNETDDGGKVRSNGFNQINIREGDWAWSVDAPSP